MKRIKTVFGSHAQMSHIWAQNKVEFGFSSDRRMKFSNGVIYSYGEHFPIARHYSDDVILFTTENYSSSTSKHMAYVSRAIGADKIVYYVPRVMASAKENHEYNLQSYRKRYSELFQRELKRIKFWSRPIDALASLRADYVGYAHLTGTDKTWDENLDGKFPSYNPELDSNYIMSKQEQRDARNKDPDVLAKREKERARREERKAKKAEELQAEELARFFSGDGHFRSSHITDTWLRVSQDEKSIETTMRASFPIDDAKRAFLLIRRMKETGATFNRNTNETLKDSDFIKLGHFTIDTIDESGNVRAGCHFVQWEAIERVARELKIYP